MRMRTTLICVTLMFVSSLNYMLADETEDAGDSSQIARLMASKLRWKKGIALDVGPGDARVAIEVTMQTGLTIHCVDPDWRTVEQVRGIVDEADLLGTRIIVQQGKFSRLSYPSLTANLVFCGDQFASGLRDRDFREIYRVLSPNGIAVIGQSAAAAQRGVSLTRDKLQQWLKAAEVTTYEIVEQDGIWAVVTRPYSPGWDDWTHRNHDPANTLASQDQVPFTTFRPQWVSDYRPGVASAGIALADGRVVVAGLSYPDHPDTTPYIQVLDAFTGVELWAKVGKSELPIDRPPGMYSNREFCSDYAVVDDRLYLLGGKFCHVIDLDNGTILKSMSIPAEVKPASDDVWLYLSCVGDVLYGGIGPSPNVKVDWNSMNYRGVSTNVFALDRQSGEQKWIHQTLASTASLTVADGRVFFSDEELRLYALDSQTGEKLWSQESGLPMGTVVAGCSFYGEKLWVLYNRPITDKRGEFYAGANLLRVGHNRRELAAYSAKDGRKLFDCDFGMTVAGFTFSGDTVYGVHQHSNGLAAVDVATGKQKWKQPSWRLKCTASLATPNCLVYRSTETSVLDLKSMDETLGSTGRTTSFGGFRPTCTFAAIPANGRLYVQAPGCRCPSPIRGSMALAPGEPPIAIETSKRLVKGEAFDQPVLDDRPTAIWASWRADRQRGGRTTQQPSIPLKQSWTCQISSEVTPVCCGYGLMFCGAADGKVIALDVESGESRWQYLAGAKIEAAPFLWQSRLYVGDQDGWVHCLRADNGKCIWRFRAALAEDRTVGYGRYASLWPVASGVLVHDGTAYCAVGLLPSEGAIAYALDARTGALKWQENASNTKRHYRVAHVPGGAMAMSDRHLYIPTKQAAPWKIDIRGTDRTSATATPTLFDSRRGGPEIMVVGDRLISVARGKEYVWHVKYVSEDKSPRLPVVVDDVTYLLNRKVNGADGTCLVAVKHVKGADSKPKNELLWKAWPGAPMNALIEASGMILSGGAEKLYATDAMDGQELWKAPVPSEVTDLAFHDGRLFAVCRSGEILCFGSE